MQDKSCLAKAVCIAGNVHLGLLGQQELSLQESFVMLQYTSVKLFSSWAVQAAYIFAVAS